MPIQMHVLLPDMTAEYRVRSIDNVMKEAAHFYEKYRFNILYVHDEYFTNRNGKKISEFCRKVKQLKKEIGSDFDWGCYMRINDFERPLLIEMEDAGCKHIGSDSKAPAIVFLRA